MAGGKGGIVVDRGDLDRQQSASCRRSPSSSSTYVQDPTVAHTVAFAEGTFNPVAQMGNPECFKLFTHGGARRHPVGQPRRGDGGLGRVRHRARTTTSSST